MNKRITNIIMGLLLVLFMGILVGCPTEAPKEKDKSGGNDPTPRVPIDIDGTGSTVGSGFGEGWRIEDGDWRFQVVGDDVHIIEYKGTDKADITSIVIPTTVEGMNVVEIKGFRHGVKGDVGIFVQNSTTKNENITSVDMFNATHLLKIDSYAFSYMTKVASVILPDGLKTIGISVFVDTGLTSIILPEGLTTIGNSAFGGTTLKSIIIPNTVTAIGNSAFAESSLESVILPEGLKTIEEAGFRETKLTSIVLPRTLESIGHLAFENTSFLKTVVILRSATPLTAGVLTMFFNTPMNNATKPSTIYYPTGTAYKTTDGWKTYYKAPPADSPSTWIEGTP